MSLLSLTLLAALGGCAEGGLGEPALDDGLDEPALDDEPAAELAATPDAGEPTITVEQVKLNGLTFDVRTAGPKTGDVVILLHGFPESSYEWRYQIPALARAGYRVLAPDLRGTSVGARPTAVNQYGLLKMVDDVVKLASAKNAKRFHLVGHDVGALVAWGTSQLYGGKLKSLTAISVPHPGAFAEQLSDPNSCQSKASAWYNDVVKPGSAERLLRGEPSLLLDVWSSFPPEAAAEYRRQLGTPAALDSVLNIWRANFKNGKPQGALPIPITVPTLYVWGDQDPYNCGDGEPATKRLVWGRYQFARFEGVGHWIPEQATERFNELLLAHLRRNR